MQTQADTCKFSKVAAHYGDVSKYPVKIRSCGICDHFVPGGACTLVEGKIAAGGGCALYSPEVLPCDVVSQNSQRS